MCQGFHKYQSVQAWQISSAPNSGCCYAPVTDVSHDIINHLFEIIGICKQNQIPVK